MKFNIAIDGPSGAGKTSVAKEIAKRLNFVYIDTGAMYRAVGLYILKNNIDINDEKEIIKHCDNIEIDIAYSDGIQEIMLNKENVTGLIRTEQMSRYASICSTYLKVREKLVELQQKLAAKQNVVMEGRDIATVVLPDADLKVFLTASTKARAQRRYKELLEKGMEANLEEVEKDIEERDIRDSSRDNSPLRQADDAILVDSSNITKEEVIKKIIELYEDRVKGE